VIEVAVLDGERVFVGELGDGEEGYVDADWFVGVTAGPVPAVVATAAAVVSTWNGQTIGLQQGRPAQHAVADALTSTAAAASEAAASARRPVVRGNGFVAAAVRALLVSKETVEEPDLIVESRGDPASLLESTRQVADLGTVVFAGVPTTGPFPFDLYPDVHVRGLRLVAVPLDLSAATRSGHDRVPPSEVRLGEPIGDAEWYRVRGR
jgi:hypothetical protein